MKSFLVIFITLLLLWGNFMFSQKIEDFEIIPSEKSSSDKSKDPWTVVKNILNDKSKWKTVIERYRRIPEKRKCEDLGVARATWVFNRNLILCYFKYLIKFLSQVGLVIWALMIIYAWYLYASAVFSGSNPQKWATAIKNAILWVIIIISSYAILKILVSMFL